MIDLEEIKMMSSKKKKSAHRIIAYQLLPGIQCHFSAVTSLPTLYGQPIVLPAVAGISNGRGWKLHGKYWVYGSGHAGRSRASSYS